MNPVSEFDQTYTTNELNILKAAILLLPREFHPLLAAYIKARELMYCLDRCNPVQFENFRVNLEALESFAKAAYPYLNNTQKDSLEQFQKLKQSFELFQKFQSLSSLTNANDTNTDNAKNTTRNSSIITNILNSNMSETQRKQYEKFQEMFR